jgi:hypothetical protein
MKGLLRKIEERWMVATVCYADLWSNYIPLHPDDVKEIEEWLFDNLGVIYHSQEVEFEIVQFIKECKGLSENCFMESPAFNCGCQQNYAKLINTEEKNDLEEEAVKLAELKVKLFERGYVEGYKNAKETLYTEEQVKFIVEKSRETGLTAEYLMLSLKQPK